jgi:hypothetical protein
MLEELGLSGSGPQSSLVELADTIRDHINEVTRRAFEFRSVEDLEWGL